MVAALAGLVAIAMLGISMVSILSTRSVLNREVSGIVTNEADRAAQATRNFLLPAEQAASVTAGQIENRLANGVNAELRLEADLLTILRNVPQLDGIFVGGTDGSFLFINRDDSRSPDGTRTKNIRVTGESRVTTLTWRNTEGVIVDETPDPEDTYDPRTRPWFQAVTTETDVAWTDPYIFFTSQKPGITASAPVVVDGQIGAVVGVDVQLEGLDGFLESLATTSNTSAALIDGDRVISILNGEATTSSDESTRYRTIDDLDNSMLDHAFRALEDESLPYPGGAEAQDSTTVLFEDSGQPAHASFAPLSDTSLPWFVVVAAPESDFLTELQRSQILNLYVVAFAGLTAIFLAAMWARSVSKPLTLLRESARELRAGHVGSPVQSRFVEIAETAEALFTAHSELEDRVNSRTEELQVEVAERRDAELRALAASKSKSEFLANISHELRTPLTAVIGYANLLSFGAADLTTEEVVENATVIEDAGSHLLALINDILDLAKIEAGESSLDESAIDMVTLTNEVDRLIRPRAVSTNVNLLSHCDEDLILFADRRRVKQILLNLASNAVKFSASGDTVNLRISKTEESVRIVVADTGIGMTEDELETAMEMFGQVRQNQSASAGKNDGTGIGLPLTLRLVNEHLGTLHIESTPGEGTSVTVTFPVDRTVQPKPTR